MDELISKSDVVKIIKSVLSPASSLVNVARARRQMLNEINELESKPEPHWIPVTERLPAMGKSVLMCDIDGDIYLGHRTQCGYYYPDFCGDRVKNVTAWCNLPEPYKGVTT